jgi:hypothetical protein
VSSYCIAQIVAPVVTIREAEHRANIGSLIEEALLEFSFLEASQNDSSAFPEVGSAPLDIDAFQTRAAGKLADLGEDDPSRRRC